MYRNAQVQRNVNGQEGAALFPGKYVPVLFRYGFITFQNGFSTFQYGFTRGSLCSTTPAEIAEFGRETRVVKQKRPNGAGVVVFSRYQLAPLKASCNVA
jgi:hypothetical protein